MRGFDVVDSSMAESVLLPDDVTAWARAEVAAGRAESIADAIAHAVYLHQLEDSDPLTAEKLAYFAKLGEEAEQEGFVSEEEARAILAELRQK
jgi:hypothetical protein